MARFRPCLLVPVAALSACFADAIGSGAPGGEGAADATTTGAPGAGGEGRSTTATMATATFTASTGPAGGEGGSGGQPCTSQGAIFDGVDDVLTVNPPSNIMSDSTDFKFRVRVDPSPSSPDGTVFVAGRYDPAGSAGWALLLVKTAADRRARAVVYQTNSATPCEATTQPIAAFPAVLEIVYEPNMDSLSVTADGAAAGSSACSQNGLANATSVPFQIGLTPALGHLPYAGTVDDVAYISAWDDPAPCDDNDPRRDRAWDFENVVDDQLVAPEPGCTDDLVLGASAGDTIGDPVIGCIP